MKLIYQIQQSVRNYLLRKSYYKLYKVIYHNNPLLKKKAVFEEKWLQKWKSLDSHIKIDSYRIFSRYVGEDINILPLEYCATVIEPFLNPKQFWAYYNDKNMTILSDCQQKDFIRDKMGIVNQIPTFIDDLMLLVGDL